MKKLVLLFLFVLPQYLLAQSIVSTGNEVIFVRPNTTVSTVDGLELKGSSQNRLSLPLSFNFNQLSPYNNRVLMGNPNVVYQVRSVSTNGSADFFTDIPYAGSRTKAEFGLTNKSATGDFNLRLQQSSRIDYNDIPLEWIVSKSNSNVGDRQDLIFSWGEELEPVLIPFKRLFVFDPATEEWEQLPEDNTTVDEDANRLTFSEYDGALSNTRFMLAQAIPQINLNGTFTDILWCPEIASPSQTFTVEAFDLTNNLTVTAPANFEIALSEEGTYLDQLVIAPSNGKVPLTTLFVRIKATASASGTFSIVASSFDDTYTVDSKSISITSIPDITPPVLSLRNLTLFLDDNGRASYTVEDIDTGSTDDCNVNLYAFPNVFSCGDVGVNNVLVFGIDKSGNITFSDITVTVLDNIFPTITAPEDLTIDADANCTASGFSLGNPVADDNCNGFTVTNNAPSVFSTGTTTVTWTVTDASGNVATDTQQVTIVDTTAPTITGPGLITVNATDNCTIANADVDFQLTTSDNCAVTLLENDGPIAFDLGFTTIVWTISDAAGNTSNFTQMIRVVDNTGPVFGVLADIEIPADANCEVAGYNLSNPQVTDNCSIASISNDAPSSFPIGTTTVTWTATDVNGNESTATQKVIVLDQTAPVITCPTLEQTYDNTKGLCGLLVTGTVFDAQATDNCEVISLTHNYGGANSLTSLSGATFPVGTTPVTWTATDAAGNTSSCTIDVVIEDKEDPVFTNFPPSTLTVGTFTCGNISNWNIPTVADNCGIQSLVQTAGPAPDAVLSVGTYIVSYKVTDIHGNESIQSFELLVDDSNLPRLVCPEDLIAQSTDTGSCTWTADETLTPKQATGNCIDLTWSVVFPDASIVSGSGSVAGTVFPLGTSTLTYKVEDNSNQVVTCTTQVTIVDRELPIITAPVAIVIGADTGECTASGVNLGTPTISDNCGVASVTNDAPLQYPLGTTTVTWTVTDNAGNTATATQTVTVQDNESPTITAPNDITIVVDEACEIESPILGDPVIADNCGSVTVTNNAPAVFPVGETLVTWTATDEAGNTATDTQLIKVEDIITPTFINCPDDITIGTYTGCATGPTWKAPIPVDNCGIASFSQISGPSSGDVLAVGTYTVTYRAVDHSGNASDCSFDITVTNDSDPVIVCMDDITVSTSDPAGCIWISEPNSLSLILAEGNCPIAVSYTITSPSGLVTTGVGDASGEIFQAGTSILTYTVTDDNGKTASCSSEVKVIESIPPTILAPADITVDADGSCEAVIESLGVPVATDNCVIVTVTNDAPSSFPIGTTTVTWTATDASNNTATATQNITVVDNNAPVIADLPANISIGNDASSCDATVTWTAPIATDNCAGVTLTSTHDPGDIFSLGTTTVTYTATDAAGNTSSASFTVTVNDTENPTITPPANVIVDANNSCFAFAVALGTPSTADNCGVASVTNNAPGIYPPGVTTVTWTVTDNAGNTAIAIQTVTVNDVTPPMIFAPADLTVDAGENCEAIFSSLGNPVAFDNCGMVTVTNDAPLSFQIGTTEVTWTATDAMNNTSTAIQLITVINKPATAFAGPDAVVAFGQSFTLSGAMANNYTSLNWSASSGTFNNKNALNPTYTPSFGSLTFIDGVAIVELTLTASSVTDCGGPFVSTMFLTITEKPAANAGPDAALCISDDMTSDVYELTGTSAANGAISWITSGTGTFANGTTLTPTYTPSAADIASGSVTLTMRVTGEGGTDTDSMVLTLWRQALVSAGPDAVIAAGNMYTLSGATASNFETLTWTAPSGTFNNKNALNPTYNPDLSALNFTGGVASVELRLTASGLGNCVDAVDTMVLTINENSTVNAGADAEICITGDPSNDFHKLIGTSAVNGTISWSTSGTGTFDDITNLNPRYTPSLSDIATGSVTLTLTVSGAGGSVSDSMVLTLWSQALAQAGSDAVVAAGLNYTLSGARASNYESLFWTAPSGTFNNSNALNPIYIPDLSALTFVDGEATVTLTLIASAFGNCTDAVDTMLLTITENPAANAGTDAEICITGDASIDLYILSESSAANGSVRWSTSGTGTFDDHKLLHPQYRPSLSDIASGSVTLKLSVTGEGGTVSDGMVLTLWKQALVNAGPDAVMAAGGVYTLSGAQGSNFETLTWSAPSGTFNNSNALNPTYIPDLSVLNFVDGEATVALTLTASGLGNCADAVDTMLLTISENAAVNAGADAEICITGDVSNEFYKLIGTSAANGSTRWSTSGTGTFDDITNLNPRYTPSLSDIATGSVTLTLTVSGAGGSVSDSMVLTLWSQALAQAGSDAVVAAGLNYTLSGARASNYESLFWTAPSGTFNNSNALNPTFIPDLSALTFVDGEATVTLTLTASAFGNCTAAVDTMLLIITENPAANAGTDAEICITGDGSIDLYILSESSAANGSVRWSTSGTGTFDDHKLLHPQYRPSLSDIAAGSVTLTLSVTGEGGTVSDGMVLTLWKQAVAFAGNDVTICNTNTYQVLDATATNYSTLQWTHNGRGQLQGANSLFPVYIPENDEFDVVKLTLTVIPEGAACSPVSSNMLIDLRDNQAPKIDAPDDLTIMITQGCNVEDVFLGTPVVSDNCAIESFSNDAPAKFPLGETKVTWTVIDAAGNTSSSVQLVKVIDNMPPKLTAPIDLVIDSGQNCAVELLDLGTPEFSDNCQVVNVSNNAPKVFPIGETLVTWEATDGSGNMTQAIQKIIVKDSVAPTIIAPADITLFANNSCAAFNVELGQAVAADNCAVLSVSNDAPVILQVGQHKITWTVIDTSGNKAIAEQLVTVIDNTAPSVVVKPITVSLEANGLVVITPDMVDNGSFDNCAIANMTLDKTLFTEANVGDNLVILTVTDIHGNTASSSTNIKIEPFGISSNPSFISGIVYESKDYFVNWGSDDFGDVLPDSLEIVTGNGFIVKLPVIWDTKTINSLSRGSYPITGALVLNQYITNPFEINGQVTVHVLAKPFLQEVTLTNNTFDSQTDLIDVPIGDFIITDEYDQIHIIRLDPSLGDNKYFKLRNSTLYWSTFERLEGREEFVITIQVEDRDGNIFDKSFTITRQRPSLFDITIFNMFSPNGDGANDKWGVPELRFYTGVRIQVFERSGAVVFNTTNPDEYWDGTHKGKELPVGTYFWIIEVKETGEVRKGMLNLLRK